MRHALGFDDRRHSHQGPSSTATAGRATFVGSRHRADSGNGRRSSPRGGPVSAWAVAQPALPRRGSPRTHLSRRGRKARANTDAAQCPARLGDSVASIDTPALVVDLDPFERNLELMANAVRGSGLALRPHAKSHKCPDIAKQQIAHGAVGICCQKVDEAAAFVEAGIRDVLVTNEIVVPAKLARLAGLARTATIGVLADDLATCRRSFPRRRRRPVSCSTCWWKSTSARIAAASVPGPPAVALAQAVAAAPGLRFRGLHAYHGAAQHLRTPGGRRAAIAARSRTRALSTRDALLTARDCVPDGSRARAQVPGSSSATVASTRNCSPARTSSWMPITARNALAPDDHAFEQSLYVAATVMSTPAPERAIVDAGLKAFAFDSGSPVVRCRARTRVCRRVRRARRAARGSRVARPVVGRARLARSRPLRSDGQSLRLDRRRPRRSRRMRVAVSRARGALG